MDVENHLFITPRVFKKQVLYYEKLPSESTVQTFLLVILLQYQKLYGEKPNKEFAKV
jgi:hypothetical protein